MFQVITLQDEQYRSIRAGGKIDLPSIASAEEGDRFAYRSKTTYIVRGFPEIRRYDFQVVRRDDGKVLAEQTQFSRVGGDVLAIQPSHFGCPKFQRSLYEMTFQISE